MTYQITITQSDIDNGKSRNCRECPVALVLNRATNKSWNVGLFGMWFELSKSYEIQPKVRRFMYEFDNGFNPNPISFNINL